MYVNVLGPWNACMHQTRLLLGSTGPPVQWRSSSSSQRRSTEASPCCSAYSGVHAPHSCDTKHGRTESASRPVGLWQVLMGQSSRFGALLFNSNSQNSAAGRVAVSRLSASSVSVQLDAPAADPLCAPPHQHSGADTLASASVPRTTSSAPASSSPSAFILEPYLQAADALEVSYAAMLSDLCNTAYDIRLLSEEWLLTQHHLQLVCTSASPMYGPLTREEWSLLLREQRSTRPSSPSPAVQQRPNPQLVAAVSHTHEFALSDGLPSRMPHSPHTPAQQSSSTSQLSYAVDASAVIHALQATALAQHNGPAVLGSSLPSLGTSEADGDSDSHADASHQHHASGELGVTSHCLSRTSGSPLLTPSISVISLSSIDETVHHAMGLPETYHYPMVTFMPTPAPRRAASPAASRPQTALRHTPLPPAPKAPAAAAATAATPQGSEPGCRPGLTQQPQAPATAARGQQHAQPSSRSAGSSGRQPAAPMPLAVPLSAGGAGVLSDNGLHSPQAAALTSQPEPPTTWFACDDSVTKTRYFVIQGSTSVDHWKINTQFEPVIFEDPALGVRVHRGVYQAALQLYADMLPVVRQHLATSPFATVAFTGHSLGGSLATLLQLLLIHRGVLPADSASPVYTFGAPAVLCGGAGDVLPHAHCEDCGLACPEHALPHAPSAFNPAQHTHAEWQPQHALPHGVPGSAGREVKSAAPTCQAQAVKGARAAHGQTQCPARGLLAHFGLSEAHITNVIMHRDIVPRAFACDYTLVADLLQQWMPSFRDLSSLKGSAHRHKTLYAFLGRVTVLMPDPHCPFVQSSDMGHPYLQSGPGLYHMADPPPAPLHPGPHAPSCGQAPRPTRSASLLQPTVSLHDHAAIQQGPLVPVDGSSPAHGPHTHPVRADSLQASSGSRTAASTLAAAVALPLRLHMLSGDFDMHESYEELLLLSPSASQAQAPAAAPAPPGADHRLPPPPRHRPQAGAASAAEQRAPCPSPPPPPLDCTIAAPPVLAASAKHGSKAHTSVARGSSGTRSASPHPEVTSLKDAVLLFVNHPHPLTTLTEVAAYGPNGSISRYHNPDHYTKALDALVTRPARLAQAAADVAAAAAPPTTVSAPRIAACDAAGSLSAGMPRHASEQSGLHAMAGRPDRCRVASGAMRQPASSPDLAATEHTPGQPQRWSWGLWDLAESVLARAGWGLLPSTSLTSLLLPSSWLPTMQPRAPHAPAMSSVTTSAGHMPSMHSTQHASQAAPTRAAPGLLGNPAGPAAPSPTHSTSQHDTAAPIPSPASQGAAATARDTATLRLTPAQPGSIRYTPPRRRPPSPLRSPPQPPSGGAAIKLAVTAALARDLATRMPTPSPRMPTPSPASGQAGGLAAAAKAPAPGLGSDGTQGNGGQGQQGASARGSARPSRVVVRPMRPGPVGGSAGGAAARAANRADGPSVGGH